MEEVTDQVARATHLKVNLHNNHIIFTQTVSLPGGGLEASRGGVSPRPSWFPLGATTAL